MWSRHCSVRQRVVGSLFENLYLIIRRNASCVDVHTWSCAVSARDRVSKKWDGAITIKLNAEAHRMISSTQDLDLQKIHKGIFTHDKAKMKWIGWKIEPQSTPESIHQPSIHLGVCGIQYTSGYTFIHTQHYGIRGVCTCSETKHNPNTFQTEKRLLNHIRCIGFMAMTMRKTA